MPWLEANGLLPGRGAPPGRGADGAAGPGVGAGAPPPGVAGASDVAGAAGVAAASAAAGAAGVAGPGTGAAGFAGPGRAPVVGRAAAAGVAGDAGAGAAALLPAPSASRAVRSFRATGGAIVDEGLLTYSPSSFSFARATFESTPSSEAISCTRGFATFLLSGVHPDRVDRYLRTGLISSRSLCVHSRSAFSLVVVRKGLRIPGRRVEGSGHAQCSSEGPATEGRRHARVRVMHPRAPTRKDGLLVSDEHTVPLDDPQQGGSRGTHAASHARSNSFHPTPGQASSRIESGWMSIFAPVSLAASRAFWPSLPIARDSW